MTQSSGSKIFRRESADIMNGMVEIAQSKISGYTRKYEGDFDKKALRRQFVKRRDVTVWTYREKEYSEEIISMTQLAKGIKLSKKMFKLQLEFIKHSNTLRNHKGLSCLSQTLKKLRSLRSTNLSFTGDGDPKDPRFNHKLFSNFLKPLKSQSFLHTVNLAFMRIPRFIRTDIFCLNKSLKSLRHLKTLNLAFNKSINIRDQELKALTKYLKRHPPLENIHLDFESCSYATVEGFLPLIETLKKMSSLNTLAFKLGRLSFFSDNELAKLQPSLKEFAFLKSLSLDFTSGGSSSVGREALMKNLVKCTNLHSIGFPVVLHQIKMKEEYLIIQKALGNLARIKSLRSLSLDFYGSQKIDHRVMKIVTQILERLTSLQNFVLDFQQFRGIDDSNLNILFEGLKRSNTLQNLTLIFPEDTSIIDKEFRRLCEQLSAVASLKTLTFIFDTMREIFPIRSITANLKRSFPSLIFSAKYKQ